MVRPGAGAVVPGCVHSLQSSIVHPGSYARELSPFPVDRTVELHAYRPSTRVQSRRHVSNIILLIAPDSALSFGNIDELD